MSAAPETAPAPGRTHALQYAFTAHIRDPERQPAPQRHRRPALAIYRDLFTATESLFSRLSGHRSL
jgi:hypothetical protein